MVPETGTPYGLETRMNAHFLETAFEKYQQKYLHFSMCLVFEAFSIESQPSV
jgi:hypothetical protein